MFSDNAGKPVYIRGVTELMRGSFAYSQQTAVTAATTLVPQVGVVLVPTPDQLDMLSPRADGTGWLDEQIVNGYLVNNAPPWYVFQVTDMWLYAMSGGTFGPIGVSTFCAVLQDGTLALQPYGTVASIPTVGQPAVLSTTLPIQAVVAGPGADLCAAVGGSQIDIPQFAMLAYQPFGRLAYQDTQPMYAVAVRGWYPQDTADDVDRATGGVWSDAAAAAATLPGYALTQFNPDWDLVQPFYARPTTKGRP